MPRSANRILLWVSLKAPRVSVNTFGAIIFTASIAVDITSSTKPPSKWSSAQGPCDLRPGFRGPALGESVARNIHSTALFLKTLNFFSTLVVPIRENHPLYVYAFSWQYFLFFRCFGFAVLRSAARPRCATASHLIRRIAS